MKNHTTPKTFCIIALFAIACALCFTGCECNHQADEWKTVKEATCTQDGSKEAVCSKCGETITEVIPATDHTVVIDAAVPTSCKETGLTEGKHCSVCNEVLVEQQEVAKLEHTVAVLEATEATCTNAGKNVYTCKVCGYSYEETIKATGHKWIAATCTVPKKCSVCGVAEGSALGHNYSGGKCTRCRKSPEAKINVPATGETYFYFATSSCKTKKIETKLYDSYEPNKLWYELYVTMESTYHKNGSYYSDPPRIGYKLYDEENIVVCSGTIRGESVAVGETTIGEANLYNLEAGKTYTLKFSSVG